MGDVISIAKRSLQQKVKKYRNIRDIRRLKEYEVKNILIKLPKVEMKDLVIYLLKQYVFPNLKSMDELDNFTKDIKHIIKIVKGGKKWMLKYLKEKVIRVKLCMVVEEGQYQKVLSYLYQQETWED